MPEAAAGALRVLDGGGASNSRPTDTTVSAGGAGFDTIRLRYRNVEGFYDRCRTSGWDLRARGALFRSTGGVSVEAYPGDMVAVEGRLAALLHGQDDHRLLGPQALRTAPDAVADLVGIDQVGDVALGRGDLASELVFPDGREGLELLRAASYVDLPHLKAGTEGGKRMGLQTVAWRPVRGRSIVLRLYDKGVETGQAAPGSWLRLERQRRWRKGRERTVDDVLASGLREAFVGRELLALVSGVEDVVVCDRDGACERLRRECARGRITGAMLEKLSGYVVQDGFGLNERTSYRRAADLRSLGIALNPNEGGASVVSLGDYMRRFTEPWELAA